MKTHHVLIGCGMGWWSVTQEDVLLEYQAGRVERLKNLKIVHLLMKLFGKQLKLLGQMTMERVTSFGKQRQIDYRADLLAGVQDAVLLY